MADPFEEPVKTEMRARSEIAVDQAGFELVANVRIALPADSGLRGTIKGDLQSLDAEGNRFCYYLRPHPADALPKWLANLATAAHSVPGIKLYVVAQDPSPAFERACRVAGAGLLLLTADNDFEHVLDFDTTLPEVIDKAFAERLNELRRRLEVKVHLRRDELEARFRNVAELTRGMSTQVADEYSEGIERQFTAWSEWGDGMARRLDQALAQRRPEMLDELERDIENGPVLDDDVE